MQRYGKEKKPLKNSYEIFQGMFIRKRPTDITLTENQFFMCMAASPLPPLM